MGNTWERTVLDTSMLPVFDLAGLPTLQLLDLTNPVLDRERAGTLLDVAAEIHHTYFPGYEHVVDEWRVWWDSGDYPVPDVIGHVLLILRDGRPVGLLVFDTNLRRQVSLVHYFAVSPAGRSGLPRGWLRHAARTFVDLGKADAHAHGTTLHGVAGEVPAEHVHKWTATGYAPLLVEYGEPRHGMHWRDFGAPELLGIHPILFTSQAGTEVPPVEVADAGLRAFLVDHYRMDPGFPATATTLQQAAAVGTIPADFARAAAFTETAPPEQLTSMDGSAAK